MRADFVAARTEWQNGAASLGSDAAVEALAEATMTHFTSQIAAVGQAIAVTIDQNDEPCGKCDLLLSIAGGLKLRRGNSMAELLSPEPGRSLGQGSRCGMPCGTTVSTMNWSSAS